MYTPFKITRKRRESAITNYKRRISLLKGNMPRVVVRKSNKSIIMQMIDYSPDGDMIKASAYSEELKKMGWQPRSNIPTAYLTGLLLARKAHEKKINGKFVLDTGIYKPVKNSVIFAAAKGVADGKIELLNSIEFDDKRLSGFHISEYVKKLEKSDSEKLFSAYAKEKFDPANIQKTFEEIKSKINSK